VWVTVRNTHKKESREKKQKRKKGSPSERKAFSSFLVCLFADANLFSLSLFFSIFAEVCATVR
jgi:hypothetical protein